MFLHTSITWIMPLISIWHMLAWPFNISCTTCLWHNLWFYTQIYIHTCYLLKNMVLFKNKNEKQGMDCIERKEKMNDDHAHWLNFGSVSSNVSWESEKFRNPSPKILHILISWLIPSSFKSNLFHDSPRLDSALLLLLILKHSSCLRS